MISYNEPEEKEEEVHPQEKNDKQIIFKGTEMEWTKMGFDLRKN